MRRVRMSTTHSGRRDLSLQIQHEVLGVWVDGVCKSGVRHLDEGRTVKGSGLESW